MRFQLLLFFFCATLSLSAQENKELIRIGDKYLKNKQYRKALPFFEQALKTDSTNITAIYKSSICHLYRYSKEKSLQGFLKVYAVDSTYDKFVYFWMARAYHLNYQFDNALKYYSMYKTKLAKWDTRQKEVDWYMEQARRAREFTSNPKNFVVQNLGNQVNSSYSEHSPVASLSDSILLFTSRRDKDNSKEDFDGEPFEDIFIVKKQGDGTWSAPELFEINTSGHDACIQFFDNDQKLFIYRQTRGGDIYVVEKVDGQWQNPKKFPVINTRGFESDAFMTADGSTVYFATNRYKKLGDLDIYYVTKKSDSSWTKPKMLKGRINTDEDEDAPFITADGKTMYFSSRGHNSMGGYDVYKTVLGPDGKWSKPENLGYPINTPDDDVYYYLSGTSNHAYMSSYRDGGFGEKDLYEIIPVESVVIVGTVTEEKTNKVLDKYDMVLQPLSGSMPNAKEATTVTQQGNYNTSVLSANAYLLKISKDGKVLKTDTLKVPIVDHVGDTIRYNLVVPFHGNPADTIPPPVIKPKVYTDNVFFAVKSYAFDAKAKKQLDKFIEYVKQHKEVQAVISGHADESGGDDINQKLSEDRAKAVYDYLKSHGVPVDRIEIRSFGDTKPLGDNTTEAGKALNRRVEIFAELL